MSDDREEPTPFAQLLESLALDATKRTQSTASTFIPAREAKTQPNLDSLPRLIVDDGLAQAPELSFSGVLGEGGRGQVKLARQLSLRRNVAVKVLKGDAPELTAELLHEARVTGTLEHPNIVPVYALGRDAANRVLLVMREVHGEPWSTLLARGGLPRGDGELERHLDVFRQVCNAIEFAHSRGIVHRDLKPDNVMLGSFGEVVVLDWGLAASLAGHPELGLPSVKGARGLAGTPAYMAPELVRGDGQEVGPWTDVYLLGAILHEIFTGCPPHAGEDLPSVLAHAFASAPPTYGPGVPAEAADICRRAMALRPGERFASVASLREAVHGFVRHRHSIRLAEAAQRRLDSLPALERLDAEASVRAHAAIAQSNFGFAQALEGWSENVAARRGLQASAEALLRLELGQGNLAAAGRAFAELPAPNEELARAVDELRARVNVKEAELGKLRALEHNLDPNVGAQWRNAYLLFMGIAWCLGPALAGAWERARGTRIDYTVAAWMWLVFAGVTAVSVLLTAKLARTNWIGRRFSMAMGIIVAAAGLFRFAGWRLGWSFHASLGAEMVGYALASALVAALIDLRFSFAAASYTLGAIAGLLFNEEVLFISAAANLVALVPTALAWERLDPWRCDDPAQLG